MLNLRKTAALILCVAMLFGCVACDTTPADPVDDPDTNSTTSARSGEEGTSSSKTGNTDSSESTTKGGLIRPPSSATASTTGKSKTMITTSPTGVTSIDIKTDVQEEMFKNLKGTTLQIISDRSNVYEDQIIAEFEDRYGVNVEVTTMGWQSFCSQLSSMVASNKAPDVACMTDATFLKWSYGNLAQPLNKYLNLKSPTWNLDDMTQFKIGNNYYGVPTYEYNGFMIYYNKTLFKEQKVADPYTEYYLKGNWTFETFRDVAKKMTIKKGDTVSTYGFATWYFSAFVQAAGGSLIKQQKNTYVSDLQSDATIKGINMIGNLYRDGSFMHNIRGFSEFGSRGVAMVAERPQNLIGNFDYYNTMKDEIGVVPFPKADKNAKEYAPALMTAYFVPNKAKNPMAGVAWMYYNYRRMIDGEANGESIVVEQRRRSVSDEHKKVFDDYFAKATKVTTKLEGLTGWGDELRGQFWGDILPENPANSKSAEEAIAGMESIINSQLKLTIGG